jgi:hypothetical protein
MSDYNIDSLASQYETLLEQQKLLTERLSDLKTKMVDIAKSEGDVDDKGSFKFEINSPSTSLKQVVYQRRVSKKLDMDAAEELLMSKGLFERCIQLKPVLDEQEIMAAYAEDLLNDSDIDTMFPESVTWATVIK